MKSLLRHATLKVYLKIKPKVTLKLVLWNESHKRNVYIVTSSKIEMIVHRASYQAKGHNVKKKRNVLYELYREKEPCDSI